MPLISQMDFAVATGEDFDFGRAVFASRWVGYRMGGLRGLPYSCDWEIQLFRRGLCRSEGGCTSAVDFGQVFGSRYKSSVSPASFFTRRSSSFNLATIVWAEGSL